MNPKNSDLLIKIAASIQENEENIEPGINLSAIVKTQLQSIELTDLVLIDRICRCIDVSKTLRTRYTNEWRRLDGSTEAPLDLWIGTIALLLKSGEFALERDSSDGRALKYLNSALKALDLCLHLRLNSDIDRSVKEPTLVLLQLWANTILASAVTAKVAS